MSGPSFDSSDPIVIDVSRNDVVESTSAIDAVVVDRGGIVVARAGDPDRVAYFRSALKPIQAAVCVEQGWLPPGDAEIAVACSSHNAEPAHLDAVRRIFEAAGIGEEALRCPPALPLYDLAAAKAGEPRPILRDCSGKHAAFLATCVARGWPLESYLDPGHPMQRAVLDRVALLCGDVVAVGIDGCGAPTPAATLARIAHAFGAGIDAAPAVRDAMLAHPFLVAGTRRVCTDVMRAAPGVVVKAGAEGIVCFTDGERSGAVKARDGAARFAGPAAVHVMRAAGVITREQMDAAGGHAAPVVLGGGVPNGSLRVRIPGV